MLIQFACIRFTSVSFCFCFCFRLGFGFGFGFGSVKIGKYAHIFGDAIEMVFPFQQGYIQRNSRSQEQVERGKRVEEATVDAV